MEAYKVELLARLSCFVMLRLVLVCLSQSIRMFEQFLLNLVRGSPRLMDPTGK